MPDNESFFFFYGEQKLNINISLGYNTKCFPCLFHSFIRGAFVRQKILFITIIYNVK